jgi:hypothetical protein
MNIFLLHMVPSEAARAHCDVHVLSQIRESCQMLSTCQRMIDGKPGLVLFNRKGRLVPETRPIMRHLGERDGMHSTDSKIYWDCYHNHPCNKWLRESGDNYMFLLDLLNSLNSQFRTRYNKPHGSWVKNYSYLRTPPAGLRSRGITLPFPLAMPEVYRQDDPVESYREYYRREKSHLYFQNGGGPMWHGYSKGVGPPDWLHSTITRIGVKLTNNESDTSDRPKGLLQGRR